MTRLKKIFKRIFESESKSRSHFGDNSTMGDTRTSKTVATSSSEAPVISAILNDPMRSVKKRIDTFRTVTEQSGREEDIAKAGFFYNSAIDRIQCFACGVRFGYPLNYTVAELEALHRETAGECEFIRNPVKAGNINDMLNTRNQNNTSASSSPPAINSSASSSSNDVTGRRPQSSSSENSNSTPPHPVDSSNNMFFEQPTVPRHNFSRSAVDYDRLKSEAERLRTFMSPMAPWPVPFIQPEDCARAGFFFVGDADKVQCAFCRGVAGEWENGDIPWMEHQRHFPRCPFICRLPVGNIPIGGEVDEPVAPPSAPRSTGYDVCGHFTPEQMGVFSVGGGVQPYTNSMLSNAELNVHRYRGIANTKMISQPARLRTFTSGTWPQDLGINPEKMAEAGFYYTGTEDQVRCFHCDGGLKNWVASDDPWVEHAKWFPECTHVILQKGEEFIRNADGMSVPSMSSGNSSDDDEVTAGVENMEIETEKPCSSGASSSGVETSSERLSPVSSLSSGDDENEPSTSSKSPVEEKEIHSQLMCKICMDNEVGVVFLPCGHLVSCPSCASACEKCAVCRQRIRGAVRAYLS